MTSALLALFLSSINTSCSFNFTVSSLSSRKPNLQLHRDRTRDGKKITRNGTISCCLRTEIQDAFDDPALACMDLVSHRLPLIHVNPSRRLLQADWRTEAYGEALLSASAPWKRRTTSNFHHILRTLVFPLFFWIHVSSLLNPSRLFVTVGWEKGTSVRLCLRVLAGGLCHCLLK